MKLVLATWPEGSKAKEFEETAEEFELSKEFYRFPESIRVQMMVHKANNEVVVEGHLTTSTYGTCVRCLDEFHVSIDEGFRRVASIVPDKQIDEDSGDPDYSFLPESLPDWDLADPMRELVMLALPDNPLCQEDCKGLCPTCGANRNKDSCNCNSASERTSMAKLGELLTRRPNHDN